MTAEKILAALREMRTPPVETEYDLHDMIARTLQGHGILFYHEAVLAEKNRIDFLCGNVGVEIKRGKPNTKNLLRQIRGYADTGKIGALIVVSENSLELPPDVNGVPVYMLGLRKLWGMTADAGTPKTETAAYTEEVPVLPPEAETAENEIMAVPPFLKDAAAKDGAVGTLTYQTRYRRWVLSGPKAMLTMASRVFPDAKRNKKGDIMIDARLRNIGDINWLMLRYPVRIAEGDEGRWHDALLGAQADFENREKALAMPRVPQPEASCFNGHLLDYQLSGLGWLMLTRRALLADEMGLGKTVQALACVAREAIYPVLIIPPPHMTRTWYAETMRFLRINGKEPRVHILTGLKPYPLPEADVYILHYLLLRGWKNVLPKLHFHTVIFDEVQELRRTGSEKYSAASLLSDSCVRLIALSGTPIYNYGGEIWNVINAIEYHFLGDWETFTRQWCTGYGNILVKDPEELGRYLRSEGLMLRRTKQQVLPELPEKRRLVQEIDSDDRMYAELMKPVLEKLKYWVNNGQLTEGERALLENDISLEARRASGVAKAPYVCRFVRALVTGGEKVLLFAHHHAVMDIYARELEDLKPVFITGRESAAQKDTAQRDFMEGKTELCCVSLRAASGLNLQRATCVVFGELDWSPAVHSQAEDRAHRIGQRDSLLCYYLVAPHGSDEVMQNALGLKVSQFTALMGESSHTSGENEKAGYARMHVENLVKQMLEEEKRNA